MIPEKSGFPFHSNASARVAALLAGDVDLIDFVPTADIEKLKKDPKTNLARSVLNRVIYLHFDSDRDVSPFVSDINGNPMTKNPLKDVRVRRAISKAISRDAMSALLALMFGGTMGLIAAYFGGRTDTLIMRVVDIQHPASSILVDYRCSVSDKYMAQLHTK